MGDSKEVKQCKKKLKEIRKYRKSVEKRIKEANEVLSFMQDHVVVMQDHVQDSIEFLDVAEGWLLSSLAEEGAAEKTLIKTTEGE